MPRKSALESGILTDAAFYILSTIVKENHGYMIMKNIEELSQGSMTIGPASLYTTLKKLKIAGLITRKHSEDESIKVYQITSKGKEVLMNDINRKKQMISFAENFLMSKEDDYEI